MLSRIGLGFSLAAAALFAQPQISPKGIFNAASYNSPGLPGGSVARGSIFSIFGKGLGPAGGAQVSTFPLQAALAGVSIKVTQGGASADSIPLFVSASQINAIMPSGAPLGVVSVQVTVNGVRSNPAPVTVVDSSPGLFAANGAGFGPGSVQNFVSSSSLPVNSTSAAARPGQIVTLWGTGLGPVAADNVAPAAGDLPTPVEVFVGGKFVPGKLYSGRSPCCAGVDQITIQLPNDVPLGCYLPVQVRTRGGNTSAVSSNVVTIAVTADGSPCADPFKLAAGGRLGAILLGRASLGFLDAGPLSAELSTDFALATFRQELASPRAFNPAFSWPPSGTCTLYTAVGDLFGGDLFPGIGPTGKDLDAGPALSAVGPGLASITFQDVKPAYYSAFLGGNLLLPGATTPQLDPGSYLLSGPGGSDVGPFQGSVASPAALTWTNQGQISSIVRAQDLSVTWTTTAAPSNQVALVIGGNVDIPTNSSAVFFCVAPAAAGSLTIPSAILGAIPPSRAAIRQSKGLLAVGTLAPPTSFSAPGLDSGFATYLLLRAMTVSFR